MITTFMFKVSRMRANRSKKETLWNRSYSHHAHRLDGTTKADTIKYEEKLTPEQEHSLENN
jgi:hypothetical protein